MRRLDIPAVYAAIALEPGELDRFARKAAKGQLRVVELTVARPVRLLTRSGEATPVSPDAFPGMIIDLARIGLAAVRGAYDTPGSPIGDLVSEEVARIRAAGLALAADPGAPNPTNGD